MSDHIGGAIGATIGGVIGFFAGGPAGAIQGAAIGYQLGSSFDPPKVRTIEGPTLDDLRVQGASYGAPISKVFGRGYPAHTMIFSVPLRETESRSRSGGGGGGKGGGGGGGGQETETVTFTPYFSGAFILCEGPIVGIKRIKADGKVILDNDILVSASRMSNNGITAFTLGEGKYSFIGFTKAKFTVYLGTPTQEPDPWIESVKGVGNVPAYRNRAYIVIQDLDLTTFGKRIPLLEFEVVNTGAFQDKIHEPPVTVPLIVPGLGENRSISHPSAGIYAESIDQFILMLNSDSTIVGSPDHSGIIHASVNVSDRTFNWNTNDEVGATGEWLSHGWAYDDSSRILWTKTYNKLRLKTAVNGQLFAVHTLSSYGSFILGNANSIIIITELDEVWISHGPNIEIRRRSDVINGVTINPSRTISLSFWGGFDDGYLVHVPHRQWVVINRRGNQRHMRILNYEGQQVGNEILLGASGEDITSFAVVDELNDSIWYFAGTRYLRRFSLASLSEVHSVDLTGGVGLVSHYFDIDKATGEPIVFNKQNNQIEFRPPSGINIENWIDLPDSLVTANGPVQSISWIPKYRQVVVLFSSGNYYFITAAGLGAETILIKDIVQERCTRAGIPLAKLDLFEITEGIGGIQFDGLMEGRAAINTMRTVGMFDLGMSNGKVKARKRGGAAVKTIKQSELVLNDDGSIGPEILRNADSDVWGTIEVGFFDPAADLEVSYQALARPSFLNGDTNRVSLPMVLTPAQARRAAEVMVYSSEHARNPTTLNTTRVHLDIEQYDPFDFEWNDGSKTRMIVNKSDFSFPMRMDIEAHNDDASLYSIVANGVASGAVTEVPTAGGGVQIEILDIPILRSDDNYSGFYVRLASDSKEFGSATLYESLDSGETFNPIGAFGFGVLGYALTQLPTFTGAPAWDYKNTVDVLVGANDTLESYTDKQVYAGLGACMLGREMVQYMTATLIASKTYRLSSLLRGRRGTEWAVGTHVAGERFVPLGASTARVSSSAYLSPRLYKAVPPGWDLDDSPSVFFENQQVGMKPFAVSNIRGTRDASNNLTGFFVRRSRIGSAWGPTVDIPLGEDVEKYEVDIMSGVTVKRTITVLGPFTGDPNFAYSAANQTADSFTPGQLILVNIYQMSSLVGRGYVGVATI